MVREVGRAPLKTEEEKRMKRRESWKKLHASRKGTVVWFKLRIWAGINCRTVNGSSTVKHPKIKKTYLDKGVELRMSRDEWNTFCDLNKDLIESLYASGDRPTVDRIDSNGHYELSNIRILSLRDNVAMCEGARRKVRDLDTGIVYRSIEDAARALNVHSRIIQRSCTGHTRRNRLGLRFEYVKKETELDLI